MVLDVSKSCQQDRPSWLLLLSYVQAEQSVMNMHEHALFLWGGKLCMNMHSFYIGCQKSV